MTRNVNTETNPVLLAFDRKDLTTAKATLDEHLGDAVKDGNKAAAHAFMVALVLIQERMQGVK